MLKVAKHIWRVQWENCCKFMK